MTINIFLNGKKEPAVFKGDKVDVLDFEMNGRKYKQIRIMGKRGTKSEYIAAELIKKVVEVKER